MVMPSNHLLKHLFQFISFYLLFMPDCTEFDEFKCLSLLNTLTLQVPRVTNIKFLLTKLILH